MVGMKIEQFTQTEICETSAPDSEKSGPSCDEGRTIKTIEGMQHVLLTLTQGIKKMIRGKTWSKKAHAQRERRHAARQKKVGYQPSQFPTDSPLGEQQDVSTVDIGRKSVEVGTQPPTQDWAPPSGVIQGTGWTIGKGNG
jgi:hypothetical protein